MSSILDALRKVEAERAAQDNGADPRPDLSPVSSAPPAGMDVKTAEAALERRRRGKRQVSPWLYVASGAVLLTAMLTVSTVLALKLAGTGNGAEAQQTPAPGGPLAAVSAPKSPPAPMEPPPVSTPVQPHEVPVAPHPVSETTTPAPLPRPAPTPAPAAPSAQPAPPSPVPQAVIPQPAAPTVVTVQFTTGGAAPAVVTPAPSPVPRNVEPAPSAASATPAPLRVARVAPPAPKPSRPGPVPEKPRERPLPDDIRKLPPLRETEKRRYGLENMTINMLKEPSPDRPYAHAIINMEKVYVGERIAGSEATLIAVRRHGIALEIKSTGERYYYED